MQFRPRQGGPWPRATSNIFASSPPITTTVLQPVQKINILQLPQRPTQRSEKEKANMVGQEYYEPFEIAYHWEEKKISDKG